MGLSELMFGRVYKLARSDGTAVVLTQSKIFNRMLNRFFDEQKPHIATLCKLSSQEVTALKPGDFVTIRKLEGPRPRLDITHNIESLVFTTGNVMCPFSSRKVEGENFLIGQDSDLPTADQPNPNK